MKIAIFTDLYLEVPGGIPSSIAAQKAALEKLGHEVVVFCPGSVKKDKKRQNKRKVGASTPAKTTTSGAEGARDDVVIIPTCKHIHPGGAPLARNPEVVEQWVVNNFPMFNQFDIVHVHYEAGASIAGAKLARRFRIPLVQTMHGREDMAVAHNIPHPFKTLVAVLLNWFHVWFVPHKTVVAQDNYLANTFAKAQMWTLMVNQANYADVVLTPSKQFGEKLEHYGVERPLFTVSNGVDDALVMERKWPVRNLKKGEPLKIIWNSRVSKEKRIIPFLEAVYLADVPIRLDVYGDGNQLKKAKRLVTKHKKSVKVKVNFHGRVPHEQLLDKLTEQHLSATVSYGFDTQGLTLLEAEATGLPVFYCDPELGESVPEAGGILTKSPEPVAMAEALKELYQHPERVSEMSKVMLNEREKILQSRQVKRLQKIYQAVLN